MEEEEWREKKRRKGVGNKENWKRRKGRSKKEGRGRGRRGRRKRR